MKNIKKILYILCILVIIAGIIVWKNLGFNYSTELANGTTVEIYFDNSTNKQDIEDIAKEVFGNNIKVKEVERFSDAFAIKISGEATDEQKSNLVSKINEKYGIEKTTEDLKIIEMPAIQGRDLAKNYIKPTIISTIVILLYLTIRYRKIGNIKLALITLIKTAIITGAYFGLVIITRLSIVSLYTIPVGMFIAIIVLITLCYKNENKLEEINSKNK